MNESEFPVSPEVEKKIDLGGIPKEIVAQNKEKFGFSEGLSVLDLGIKIGRDFEGKTIEVRYCPLIGDESNETDLQICAVDGATAIPEAGTPENQGWLVSQEDFIKVNKELREAGKIELPESMIAGAYAEPNIRVEMLTDNGPFFGLLGITDENGDRQPLIMNKKVTGKETGDTNIVSLPDGQIVLVNRQSLWGTRPEVPRSYAKAEGWETRFREETGIRGELVTRGKILVWEDPLYMGSRSCVNVASLEEQNRIGEMAINGGVTHKWVDEMAKIGMIRDSYTLGGMLVAGLVTGEVVVNPNRSDQLGKKIIFEEKLMTQWDGKKHLFLPRGSGEGLEIGGAVSSNCGVSNIEYKPKKVILENVSGMGEKKMVGVRIANVLEEIKKGNLDMVTTAALGRYLYDEGIVISR